MDLTIKEIINVITELVWFDFSTAKRRKVTIEACQFLNHVNFISVIRSVRESTANKHLQ